MPYRILNLVLVLHSGGQTGGVNWWGVCYPWGYPVYFHQVGPLGRVGLVVMMSVRPSVRRSFIFSYLLGFPKQIYNLVKQALAVGSTKMNIHRGLQGYSWSFLECFRDMEKY